MHTLQVPRSGSSLCSGSLEARTCQLQNQRTKNFVFKYSIYLIYSSGHNDYSSSSVSSSCSESLEARTCQLIDAPIKKLIFRIWIKNPENIILRLTFPDLLDQQLSRRDEEEKKGEQEAQS